MSQFINYRGSYYAYKRDNKEFIIASVMLNFLFKTHGYCVDPADRSGMRLTSSSIEYLKELAKNNNDFALVGTITELFNGKAPSPRMTNECIMHETVLNEKHKYDNLGIDNKNHTISILKTIFNIGLYLGGWKGEGEPCITSIRPNYDIIRMELKVHFLITSLYNDQNYPLVKKFPIICYYEGIPSKPSIIDINLDVDKCLNDVSSGMKENYLRMSSYLISTSYYYITSVCKTPLPMAEPLITSLIKIQP